MRLISQFFITTLLISIIYKYECARPLEKYRLSHVFEKLEDFFRRFKANQEFAKAIDISCVNSLLKLPQNEKMIVNEYEETVFIFASILKCSDNTELVFDMIINDVTEFGSKKMLNCYRWQLKNIEPESPLIGNFEINETELIKCKDRIRFENLEGSWKNIESLIGPLDKFTCGAVTSVDDYVKFTSKGALVSFFDGSEEIKKIETENWKKYLKDVTVAIAGCIVNRFQNDPKAYLINDTLNYFLRKTFKPENYDPNSYKERLMKLINNVDVDCTSTKLNLQENVDIPLLEKESTILIASAMSKCLKIDQFEYSNLFLDFAIPRYQKTPEYVYCTKYLLRKLEPSSKLAKISEINKKYAKECSSYRRVDVQPYGYVINVLEEFIGKLDGTCAEVSDEFKNLISIKTVLLANEKDEVLKKGEAKEVFTSVTNKLHQIADCIFDRVKQDRI